jgi:endonuclease YncB( thermonuclease family)
MTATDDSRTFPARVALDPDDDTLRVIDGDTLDVVLDLGLETTQVRRVKLAGVNTPELSDPDPLTREAAQAARDAVLFWLGQIAVELEWPLAVTVLGDGPDEGSWWATVTDAAGRDLAADLIAGGHGVPLEP